ncbi:MAG: phosphopantothenoylcysteine decarboxylase [Sedimentisphaerales bacterium]|jgi:phosphopantothenoylcysteine synthetase/decarboxylase
MRILITAGGTREYIDPVRFISNASSGRMGYALASAALKAGHTVTLITAPTSLKIPSGAKVVNVETAAQMFAAVKKHFRSCDCLIMAAAVADYTPVRPAKTKLKKTGKPMTLELKPTLDILGWAASRKKKTQIVVGFALEDRSLRTRAEIKMADKNLDMIVANSPAAIGSVKSTVHIKTSNSPWLKIETTTKAAVAKRIIHLVEQLRHDAFLRS